VSHDFKAGILDDVAHRPWPMPNAPWVMTQSWHDLLFAHWPLDPDLLRPKVPASLPLDCFDGRAWIGVVPFSMRNVAPRGVPALPWLSAFPELNVRTYVIVDGQPGVYFFSLDAANPVAVWVARTVIGLPYFTAEMSVDVRGDEVQCQSRRKRSPRVQFVGRYRPTGPAFQPQRGTLEYFLTERYCLYTADRTVKRLEIHHPPWTLQVAEAELGVNTMTEPIGIVLPAEKPLLHFAKRQDAVAWAPAGVRHWPGPDQAPT